MRNLRQPDHTAERKEASVSNFRTRRTTLLTPDFDELDGQPEEQLDNLRGSLALKPFHETLEVLNEFEPE